jgi:hypothetical protein
MDTWEAAYLAQPINVDNYLICSDHKLQAKITWRNYIHQPIIALLQNGKKPSTLLIATSR